MFVLSGFWSCERPDMDPSSAWRLQGLQYRLANVSGCTAESSTHSGAETRARGGGLHGPRRATPRSQSRGRGLPTDLEPTEGRVGTVEDG
jgi:hypothetical protein